MNKLAMFATGCLAGMVFTTMATKTPARTLSISALASATTSFVACLIVDTRKQNLLNDAEERASSSLSNFQKTQVELKNAESTIGKLTEDMGKMKGLLSIAKKGLENCDSDSEKSRSSIANLTTRLNSLETELVSCKAELAERDADIQAMQENFEDIVQEEASKLFKEAQRNKIQEVFQEHDEITSEAMQLFRRLQGWAQEVIKRHELIKESARALRGEYARHIDEYSEKVSKERDAYLQEIEVLNERVGLLQHELNGDLLEPQLNNGFGYAIEGRIANDLAYQVFCELQIPLAVKGFCVRSDGSTEVGYGYSRSISHEVVVEALKRHSEQLARRLGIHRITSIRKLEITDLIVLTFRREPAVKDSQIGLLVGSAEEFITYVVNHPIRYRLIADPGTGKTPSTAVMLSAILKAGCRRGNTSKGAKVPYTLVTVSYPGVQSSLKDSDYPLELFLEYGTESAAIKSFQDAVEDWQYRKQNVLFAEQFFQIWIWDELDNTLNSASDPQSVADNLKKILKQAGHNNVGWIVSGQSVMTKQLPGFTNDDRSLFTEIIIGIPKIRHYLNTYGKGKNSDSNLAKLSRNLDEIEEYIEHKNQLVTDDARFLRVALVVDSRSPKLYFLPNLDSVNFDVDSINNTRSLAEEFKSGKPVRTVPSRLDAKVANPYAEGVSASPDGVPFSPIGGSVHCPECGSASVSQLSDGRYRCKDCKAKRVANKMVWK